MVRSSGCGRCLSPARRSKRLVRYREHVARPIMLYRICDDRIMDGLASSVFRRSGLQNTAPVDAARYAVSICRKMLFAGVDERARKVQQDQHRDKGRHRRGMRQARHAPCVAVTADIGRITRGGRQMPRPRARSPAQQRRRDAPLLFHAATRQHYHRPPPTVVAPSTSTLLAAIGLSV